LLRINTKKLTNEQNQKENIEKFQNAELRQKALKSERWWLW